MPGKLQRRAFHFLGLLRKKLSHTVSLGTDQKCKYSDVTLTTEDDIVDDISVGEELGRSNHMTVRFNFKVPHLATKSRHIRQFDFRRAESRPCALLWGRMKD